MGCYDQVRFENKDYVLPDSLPVAGIVFQTKDLGGNFSTVVIGYDGSLILDDVWRLFQDIEFDFYTAVDGVLYEYKACFQGGVLTEIKVVL